MSSGHYKRVQREKDVREWDNEYISTLREVFLDKYKIPYNVAQQALVAYNNFISAKKAIDVIGDKAYWLDDCPRTKSLIVDTPKSIMGSNLRVTPPEVFTTVDDHSITTHFASLSASKITAGMITASRLYTGTPSCSCESCDFNAKMDLHDKYKAIWDTYRNQTSSEYPEFVFENLPKQLPELSL